MLNQKSSKLSLASYWPAVLISIILLIIVFLTYISILNLNDNHFVYALDDAYIHIAISKNLIENGNYGPTPHAFEPASSSLSWNFILASIYVFTGVNELLPLILNIIFSIITIFVLQKILLSWLPNKANWIYILILLAQIIFTPVSATIFIGMEHSLHILITVLTFYFAVELLVARDLYSLKFYKLALIISLTFAFTVRFETVFLATIIFALLLLKRYFKYAFLLGICNSIPLVIMSAVFLLNKRGIFPNSVLAKSSLAPQSILRIALNVLNAPSLILFIFLGLIYLYIYARRNKTFIVWQRPYIVLLIATATILQHFLIGQFGWFFRYEAYLVTLMILTGAVIIQDYWQHRQALFDIEQPSLHSPPIKSHKLLKAFISVLMTWIIIFMCYNRVVGNFNTVHASHEIYISAYQVGTFLDEYYDDHTVILNDIGYPVYKTNIHLLDLFGLGSFERVDMLRRGQANEQTVAIWAKETNAQIAITYSTYKPDAEIAIERIPTTWVLVGQWKLKNIFAILPNDVWNIYAVDEAYALDLHHNLLDFQDQLPEDVEFVDLYAPAE